jgi:hypothetical protein
MLLQFNQNCTPSLTWEDLCCGAGEQGGIREVLLVRRNYNSTVFKPALIAAYGLPTIAAQNNAVQTAVNNAIAAGQAIKITDLLGTAKSTTETGDGYGRNEIEVLGSTFVATFETIKFKNNVETIGGLNGAKVFVMYYTTETLLISSINPVTIKVDVDLLDRKNKAKIMFEATWRVPRDSSGNLVLAEHYRLPEGLLSCTAAPQLLLLNRVPSGPNFNYNFEIFFQDPCAGGGTVTLTSLTGSVTANPLPAFSAFTPLSIAPATVGAVPFTLVQTAALPSQTLTFTFTVAGCGDPTPNTYIINVII